jgi:hypothetical protein
MIPHLLTRRRNMISDLSSHDAKAAMQKLVTNSTRVQAWYVGTDVNASAQGTVWKESDGRYWVTDKKGDSPFISVDPTAFAAGKLADKSSLPDFSPPGVLLATGIFSSALMFKLKDGSLFTIFEFDRVN